MLSTNKVIQSLTSSTSSMTFGIQNFGKDGLIISQLLAQAVVVALLIKKIKMSFLFQSFEKLKIIAIARSEIMSKYI